MHSRKRHKNSNKHQPHNFSKKISNWNIGGKISTACLYFAFPIYCRNRLFCALTRLFTGYTCKTQSHLQREISRAAVNRRVNVMVLVSSPKQNAGCGTPATWQNCVSPLWPFIVRFPIRISSPVDHTCWKSMGLLLPLRNVAYISCIQRGQYLVWKSVQSSGKGFEQQ